MSQRPPGFSTLALHAGAQAEPGDADAAALEERLAALEGGTAAVVCREAARWLAFRALMRPGDNLVGAARGGDPEADRAFASFGWQARRAAAGDLAVLESLIDGDTRAIFAESLDESGGFADLAAIAGIAQAYGLPLVVDNTRATPCLVRPVEHGADVVVHSLNGFMTGRGDVACGVVVDCGTFDWSKSGHYPLLSEPRAERDGASLHEAFGNCAFAAACRALGPGEAGPAVSRFDAALIAGGLETLALRMRRHCDNAQQVAEHLARHERIAWISYAGLPGDPGHALMRRYAPNGAGAILSFGLKDGARLGEGLELFAPAAPAGGARSAIARFERGAGSPEIRLAIGIEDAQDILADLDRALARA